MRSSSGTGKLSSTSGLAQSGPHAAFYALVLAIALQSFQEVEHVAQLYQRALVGCGSIGRALSEGRAATTKMIAMVIIAFIVTVSIGVIVGTSSANLFGHHSSTIARELPTNPPPFVPNAPATEFVHTHGLVASPERPGLLYVATHKGIVVGVNSSNFAYKWFYLNGERMDITGLILQPERPFVVYAFGHPSANEETGIRVSYDRGQTWASVTTRPDPHQWVVSLSDPRVMYATDFPTNALIRSDDAGVNWKILNPPANVLSIAIHPNKPGEILVGTDNGLYSSKDGGLTWELLSSALARTRVTAVSYDPLKPEVIYVSSFFGIMKSSDEGKSWTSIANGIGSIDAVQYISIDRGNTDVVYAAAKDTIYKTTDGGLSWTVIRSPDEG